jgi:hypothetical protein
VYVHLSTDGAWVGGRGAIPASLAAKFACDGVVQPVWEVGGTPVSVGRRQRIVPARTRRLVEDRDRGCVFPGCPARGFLEVHHLDHWADGGATDLDRLVCLCPFHHDAHHRGDFTITGDANAPGGLVFLARGGFAIGPGPTYAPPAPRDRPAPTPGSAGQVYTIGVSTLDPLDPLEHGPDGPDGPDPANDLDDLGDLGYPDEDADPGPEPGGEDELWPGVAPPVAYQGATGEVLHGKWVTFHEGPALLL